MNNIIKKVKNGGFEVVSTSYGNPVVYDRWQEGAVKGGA